MQQVHPKQSSTQTSIPRHQERAETKVKTHPRKAPDTNLLILNF